MDKNEMERIQEALNGFVDRELEQDREMEEEPDPDVFEGEDGDSFNEEDDGEEDEEDEEDDDEDEDEDEDDIARDEDDWFTDDELAGRVSTPARKRPVEDVLKTPVKSVSWKAKKPVGAKQEDNKRKDKETKAKKKRKTKKTKNTKEPEGKKKHWFIKFLLRLAAVLLVLYGILYFFIGALYQNTRVDSESVMAKNRFQKDGVTSFLLIGSDSRDASNDGRSDAIILVTISDRTKTIRMTSLLRDIYVDIPGHEGNRLNAAYSFGGADLLLETVNHNFDLDVNRYAVVNFEAFAALVDGVGGITLELSNEEVKWVNAYLNEYNELRGMPIDTDYLDPSLSGAIHLNGPQALAYCRNRYIGTDFGRTERQRKVLGEVVRKLPGAVVKNPRMITEKLLPNLTTNLSQAECTNLSLMLWKLAAYDIVQDSIPLPGTYRDATIRKMAVLEVDFEKNKEYIRKEVYGKE